MGHFVEQLPGGDNIAAMETPLNHGVPGNDVLEGNLTKEVDSFAKSVVVSVSMEHYGVEGDMGRVDLIKKGASLV